MIKRRSIKITITILFSIIMIVLAAMVIALAINNNKTSKLHDDHSKIYADNKYSDVLYIEGIDVIKQDVSCGYAVIEMFSSLTDDEITEELLFDEYGKVVTSIGKAFCNEMNKRFPDYETTMYKYLSDCEVIDMIYNSLEKGMPVPFEWAALYDGAWTLHYSLVIGIDVQNDVITVANPYGYIEELSIREFLERTSFESYDNMPIYLKLAFAFGVFEKNTVFIVEQK